MTFFFSIFGFLNNSVKGEGKPPADCHKRVQSIEEQQLEWKSVEPLDHDGVTIEHDFTILRYDDLSFNLILKGYVRGQATIPKSRIVWSKGRAVVMKRLRGA